MKRIALYLFCIALIACNQKASHTEMIRYYPFSLIDEVNRFSVKDASVVQKTITQKGKAERKLIAKADLLKDIETFKEFDINKAAWQTSFVKIENEQYTRFQSIEPKLSLKYLDVYGDLNKPERVRIYFLNTNNLYQSVKLIDWYPSRSYSIFSIQDVKGMSADTLHISCTW